MKGKIPSLKTKLIREAGGYGKYMRKYNLSSPRLLPVEYRKIGRNKPCPCESGKKFKKCCLNK